MNAIRIKLPHIMQFEGSRKKLIDIPGMMPPFMEKEQKMYLTYLTYRLK